MEAVVQTFRCQTSASLLIMRRPSNICIVFIPLCKQLLEGKYCLLCMEPLTTCIISTPFSLFSYASITVIFLLLPFRRWFQKPSYGFINSAIRLFRYYKHYIDIHELITLSGGQNISIYQATVILFSDRQIWLLFCYIKRLSSYL